jgi:tetratricopeptide (TPR) repeat protein
VATLRSSVSSTPCRLIAVLVIVSSGALPTPAAEPTTPPRPLLRLRPERLGLLSRLLGEEPAAQSQAGDARQPAPAQPRSAPLDKGSAAPAAEARAAILEPEEIPAANAAALDAFPSEPDVPLAADEPVPAAATPVVKQAADRPAAVEEMPTLAIDAASFRGALPGTTTRQELEADWGPGEVYQDDDGTTGLAWSIEPFERVEVAFVGDVVRSIRIRLSEPVAVAELAEQLEISDLRTVAVLDEQGAAIGEIYPERGVILTLKTGTKAANAIMIEPLDPDAFVLRAEGEIGTCAANAVADLLYAIEIDPTHLRAHRLLLSLSTEDGRWKDALTLAETASRLDPDDVWTQIKHAGILVTLERPTEARDVLESIQARPQLPPLVAAQAQRLLGRAALADKEPDEQAAVEYFAEAIRRAVPLAAGKPGPLQAVATEVILDAHLGTALAIARGTWQQKARVIPKWISRSEALVKDFAGTIDEKTVLELKLCRGVLAAAAGTTEAIDPTPWVKRLLEYRESIDGTITDPWRRRQIDWQVGLALGDALAAARLRGEVEDMLDNATLTAAYMERGAKRRDLTPSERRDMGELMFRIGILYSLQKGDHATAVTWFDRVVPMWEDDAGLADSEPGRMGESYVSMAISYWQVDRREDAVALSRRGVDLMVAAVDAQTLDERSLAVAYGNLATMYAEQGDERQARTYSEMATRAEAAGTKLR